MCQPSDLLRNGPPLAKNISFPKATLGSNGRVCIRAQYESPAIAQSLLTIVNIQVIDALSFRVGVYPQLAQCNSMLVCVYHNEYTRQDYTQLVKLAILVLFVCNNYYVN